MLTPFSQWIVFDIGGTLVESEQIRTEIRREFVLEHAGRWRDDAQAAILIARLWWR